MKKVFCLLILSLILLTGCGKKEEKNALDQIIEKDVLVVGVNLDSKPFGFISKTTGDFEGVDIDVARYIAKDILGSERKIKFVGLDTSSRIEAITSGRVDMAIATMTVTPQRQYLVDFSIPYYVAGQTVLVKQDSDIYSFADLKRKTIIIPLGSTAEKNIRRILPTARMIGYKTNKEAVQAFIDGQGDALSDDDVLLSGIIMDYPDYRMLKTKISHEPYAVGIKKYDDEKLKKALDVIILRMKKDGTLKQLKEKWHLK